MRKMNHNAENEIVNPDDYLAAQAELDYVREKYGIEDPNPKSEGRISKAISGFFDNQEKREKIAVNKKKLLLLLIFTGIFGGHRFYAHHYKVAVFYVLTCWTGMSIAMSIIDLLQYIPYEADENGNIYI